MKVNKSKAKIIKDALQEFILNRKLNKNCDHRKIQKINNVYDEICHATRHWNEYEKFKKTINQVEQKPRRSYEQYDLPDLPESKLDAGMYGDLHYDKNAVGEVCGINE